MGVGSLLAESLQLRIFGLGLLKDGDVEFCLYTGARTENDLLLIKPLGTYSNRIN